MDDLESIFGERLSHEERAIVERRTSGKGKGPRIKLTSSEKESVAAFARSSLQISKFFIGILDRDTVSEGQYGIVERWRGMYPRVLSGLPVRNRYPGCWIKRCKTRATIVHRYVAYCAQHAAEASANSTAYSRDRA